MTSVMLKTNAGPSRCKRVKRVGRATVDRGVSRDGGYSVVSICCTPQSNCVHVFCRWRLCLLCPCTRPMPGCIYLHSAHPLDQPNDPFPWPISLCEPEQAQSNRANPVDRAWSGFRYCDLYQVSGPRIIATVQDGP